MLGLDDLLCQRLEVRKVALTHGGAFPEQVEIVEEAVFSGRAYSQLGRILVKELDGVPQDMR